MLKLFKRKKEHPLSEIRQKLILIQNSLEVTI